jgi:hypothetical protein
LPDCITYAHPIRGERNTPEGAFRPSKLGGSPLQNCAISPECGERRNRADDEDWDHDQPAKGEGRQRTWTPAARRRLAHGTWPDSPWGDQRADVHPYEQGGHPQSGAVRHRLHRQIGGADCPPGWHPAWIQLQQCGEVLTGRT